MYKSNRAKFIEQYIELYGNEFYGNEDYSYYKNLYNDNNQLLNSYNNLINNCEKCSLSKTRTKFVFGAGDPYADLVLVGEAPGEQEDIAGEPFVGKSGLLLDKILNAIGLNREKNVFIINAVKCRPDGNRDPLPSEIESCLPYLTNQINIIQPKLIVALGKIAAKTLLKKDSLLKEMRNRTFSFESFPLRVTYHPAALLRNPSLKIKVWEDFKYIRDFVT